MTQISHAHTDIPIILSRFRQYTSTQCNVALLNGEMVSRSRGQGTSQGTSYTKSKVPFPVSWHIASSNVSRISGISKNRLYIVMRKIGTRHRRQGEGRHRHRLSSGDATGEKSAAIPRWSRRDGHSSNRSVFIHIILTHKIVNVLYLIPFFKLDCYLREFVISCFISFLCFRFIIYNLICTCSLIFQTMKGSLFEGIR